MADAPPELQGRAASLVDLTGQTHDPTEIVIAVLQRLEQNLRGLAADPRQIAARADAICLQRGRTLASVQGRQNDHRPVPRNRRGRGLASETPLTGRGRSTRAC